MVASDCNRALSQGMEYTNCAVSSGTDGHTETFQQLESLCIPHIAYDSMLAVETFMSSG